VITPGDDYPLHQTSRTVRDPGHDRNLYDRFWFNGYPPDGSSYFSIAFGIYPGRNVMDGAIGIVVDPGTGRVQHNVRASRLLGDDRLDTQVGPIAVEILEPLRRLRVTVDDESGVRADLVFTSTADALEEPHYFWKVGHRTVFDYTRLTQFGTWSGWFEVPGHDRVLIDDGTWLGSRDRSWGIRSVGESEPPGAPDGGRPGFYWLWAPVQVDGTAYHFHVNEHPDGSRWHEGAVALPTDGRGGSIHGSLAYEMDFEPGTRHARSFSADLDLPTGPVHLDLQPVYPFMMSGIGYMHPEWGHGTWHGPLARAYETYAIDGADESQYLHQHVQTIVRVTRGDGAEGIGILEQLILGPHDPSGLTGILDMHP